MPSADTPKDQDALEVRNETAALTYASGDPQLAAELLDTLLAELPAELMALRVCVAELDWPGVAEHAHQIRGATGYCGLPALDTALERLERAARIGDPDRGPAAFAEVEHQVERLRAQLG
jgi:HPt (histidine-containing phosphotransfer) domain-containing protein